MCEDEDVEAGRRKMGGMGGGGRERGAGKRGTCRVWVFVRVYVGMGDVVEMCR